jgi:hypothetical protein
MLDLHIRPPSALAQRRRAANQRAAGAVIGLSAALAAGAIYLATRPRRLVFRPVRDAGPDAMENPPQDWDRTDQALDESFPCSDPPNHTIRSRNG